MTGYTRQSAAQIIPGEDIEAGPLAAEFNALQTAFSGSTGHSHDGGQGNGPKINLTASVTGSLPVANGGTGTSTLDGLKTALGLGTAAYVATGTFATAAQGTKADGALQTTGGTMSGPIAMGGQKITGLGSPSSDTDAATKKFVTDTLASVDTSAFGAHVNNLSNPHQVTKAQVGLGNVENLSRASILDSAALTGVPTAPTAAVATNTTQIATTAFVQSALGTIPPTPAILPIEMTAPASGATDVGAGGTYTFVARAFAGDTTGFYSNYGVPVASRFVNVYEPGGTVPVKTFTATGGGPSLVANFTGSGLVVSHAYQFEFGYTDAQGNTVKSPKVSATTASQFKPSEGQAYQGGFLAYQNFGDGDLFDLVVAPKSTEANKVWDGSNFGLLGALSRLSGNLNTAKITQSIGASTSAAPYAQSVTIGGVAGYLGAIDELRAISSKLKPSVAVEAAFKAGGAEVFGSDATGYWSSTEVASNTANYAAMVAGTDGGPSSKVNSLFVRPIKRVSTIAPYPIGTAMEGGYLAAYFTDLSSGSPATYMLIVADKATEVTRAWSTASETRNTGSRTNGDQFKNFNDSRYPAFQYCSDLVSGGKTDWYLGAIDEMLAIARMNSQLPSAQQLIADQIWSSTEIDANSAKVLLADRTEAGGGKSVSARYVRAIRRVLLPAT